MTVLKVGGSLFDHPGLGPGLRAYLSGISGPKLLVPGGGEVANAVRQLDKVHGIGEEAAHWIALRALSVTSDFLTHLVRGLPDVEVPDIYTFAAADDCKPDALPHAWTVTSDSLAARVAQRRGAARLILLKSVTIPPGATWDDIAKQSGVDPYFPTLVRGTAFAVEAINFREWLETHGRGS